MAGTTLRFVRPSAPRSPVPEGGLSPPVPGGIPGTPGPAPAAGGIRSVARLWAVLGGLAAIFLFGAVGLWWAEIVLVPVTFLIAYAWWDHIVEGVEKPAERFGRRLLLNLWALARRSRTGLRSWLRQGRTEARVRAREAFVRREHGRAIRQLGEAVFAGDNGRAAEAKVVAALTKEKLERFEHERRQLRTDSRRLAHEERVATDSTREFDAAEMAASAKATSSDSQRR